MSRTNVMYFIWKNMNNEQDAVDNAPSLDEANTALINAAKNVIEENAGYKRVNDPELFVDPTEDLNAIKYQPGWYLVKQNIDSDEAHARTIIEVYNKKMELVSAWGGLSSATDIVVEKVCDFRIKRYEMKVFTSICEKCSNPVKNMKSTILVVTKEQKNVFNDVLSALRENDQFLCPSNMDLDERIKELKNMTQMRPKVTKKIMKIPQPPPFPYHLLESEVEESKYDDSDLEIVMKYQDCDKDSAIRLMDINNGDLLNAINYN